MVVRRPGTLLGHPEIPICPEPAGCQKTKSMSPERKEESLWEPSAEEADSTSSEAGRVTDSTDDEETSSTESAHSQQVEAAAVGRPAQRRLEVEQMKVMSRISQLEKEIRELQLQRRELKIEVEMERALLEGELRMEKKEVDKEEQMIRTLHEQLRETEKKWQEEREKDKLQLHSEKQKVKGLEEKIAECRAQLEKQPESLREQLRKCIQEMTEMMEVAVKSFEDLEFQQLERESSREEEREASYRMISQNISKQQNELNKRKDKILRLEEQIHRSEEQAHTERLRISEENTRAFQSLNKEKDRLLTLTELCQKDPGEQEGREIVPRKVLQRTTSLPRRRGNAFVRQSDRPSSLHGNTCLESAGLALHLAVSSTSSGGKIALAISPNLQMTRTRDLHGDDRRSCGGRLQGGHPLLPLTYGPIPKIAEMERQLREAMAEKERLLKARQEKRAAQEMIKHLETEQSHVKEEVSVPTPPMVPPSVPEPAAQPPPFDLRSYLEASGHSVETCPHVRVTAVCCKGYLVKMGGRIKTWKKRWFVFDRQKRRLAYYADKEEQKLKGVIYFQAIEEVYYDHLRSAFKSPHPKLTFCLKTFERLFCMVAPSPEAMRIWMDVMVTAAEENQRY